MAVDAKIILASEDCLQLQFNQKICPEVNGQISAFVKSFECIAKDIPGVLEIVPTYCSVSIYFDEKHCEVSLLKKRAQEVIKELAAAEVSSSDSEKIVTITSRDISTDAGTPSAASVLIKRTISVESSGR